MKINDIIQQVDLSKRAIKYYEEKGLLTVAKDTNGYRNYTYENLETLKTISVYRKLGISIDDIRKLLKNKDKDYLRQILKEKEDALKLKKQEINALKKYIENDNIDQAYEIINYSTIADALLDAIPGFTGYYFIYHFLPYLQIPIETTEQKEAYNTIVQFWDNTKIKIPLSMQITNFIMCRVMPKPSIENMIKKMDATMRMCTNPTADQYKKIKKQVEQGIKIKNNLLYKYSPAGLAQKKFMKELQNQGYNDIFIPNMIKLSPKYRAYHGALMEINQKICQELNLYYDADFNLRQK